MNFKENLLECMNEEMANALIASLSHESTHAVLLNTNFISEEDFLEKFPNVKKHPFVKNAFIYNKSEYELGKTMLHDLGCFYIQDPAAMVVSSLIDFKESDLVLDMCAAPGGKTIQASLKMNGNGLIIANDLSKQRALLISNNAERLGLSNIVVSNNDFSKIYDNYINVFDKIILDAPCSGSGMFRKDQEFINEWSINKVLKFAEIQKELIAIAYKMLKPGGTLSYSTCSYSKEEDEDVISYLLENTDAELIPLPNIGYQNPRCKIGLRLLPSCFEGEGQYICQIKKPGNLYNTLFVYTNKFKNMLPNFLSNFDVIKAGDFYFALKNTVPLKNLSVVRYGVKIGEYTKGIFHYDLHFARSIAFGNFPSIELSEKDLLLYLEGNQLSLLNNNKGIVLLTYKKCPVDLAKTDGQVIKNHYPKGLRRKYNQ